MTRTPAAALALALLAGAAAAEQDDLKLVLGTWDVASVLKDGKEVPLPSEGKVRLTLKEDGYTITVGDKTVEKGTCKFVADKTPKAVDIMPTEGPDKGKTVPAIYEVKGDEMRACAAEPGKERPTDFTAREGSQRTLSVWKRDKK